MAFTEAQQASILAALKAKTQGARTLGCPLCGTKEFALGPGVVTMVLQPSPGAFSIGGASLPCIPVICQNCGTTQLANIYVLGVAEDLGYGREQKAEG